MDFNIEIRRKQLENLDQFMGSSRDRVDSILEYLGWSAQKITENQKEMVKCMVNPSSHRIPAATAVTHVQNCAWRKENYATDDVPLSEPNPVPGSTIIIDDMTKINVLNSALAKNPLMKTGWRSHEPVPKTSNRLLATFTPDERLALYEYSVAATRGPPEVPEFNLNKPKIEERHNLTADELKAIHRDARRRRIKYKSKCVHTNRKSTTEVLRDVIESQMEQYEDYVRDEQDDGSIAGLTECSDQSCNSRERGDRREERSYSREKRGERSYSREKRGERSYSREKRGERSYSREKRDGHDGKEYDDKSYSRREDDRGYSRREDDTSYSKREDKNYSKREEDKGYSKRDDDKGYSRKEEEKGYSKRDEDKGYGKREEEKGYSKRDDDQSYTNREDKSYNKRDDKSYSKREEDKGYGKREEDKGYGNREEDKSKREDKGYSKREEDQGYSKREDNKREDKSNSKAEDDKGYNKRENYNDKDVNKSENYKDPSLTKTETDYDNKTPAKDEPNKDANKQTAADNHTNTMKVHTKGYLKEYSTDLRNNFPQPEQQFNNKKHQSLLVDAELEHESNETASPRSSRSQNSYRSQESRHRGRPRTPTEPSSYRDRSRSRDRRHRYQRSRRHDDRDRKYRDRRHR